MPAPAAWLQGAEGSCCGRSKLLPSSQTHFSVEQPPDLAVGAAMPLLITLRAAMPLVITTLRVVPLGACRPALSKGSSSTPGSTSGLPQPHSCGSTLSGIWPEKASSRETYRSFLNTSSSRVQPQHRDPIAPPRRLLWGTPEPPSPPGAPHPAECISNYSC